MNSSSAVTTPVAMAGVTKTSMRPEKTKMLPVTHQTSAVTLAMISGLDDAARIPVAICPRA